MPANGPLQNSMHSLNQSYVAEARDGLQNMLVLLELIQAKGLILPQAEWLSFMNAQDVAEALLQKMCK